MKRSLLAIGGGLVLLAAAPQADACGFRGVYGLGWGAYGGCGGYGVAAAVPVVATGCGGLYGLGYGYGLGYYGYRRPIYAAATYPIGLGWGFGWGW